MRDRILTIILRSLPRGSRARLRFYQWWSLLNFIPGTVPLGRWRFSLYYTRECKRWPYRKTPECRSSWVSFLGWHLVAVKSRRCRFNRFLQEENDMMVATFIHDYDRVHA